MKDQLIKLNKHFTSIIAMLLIALSSTAQDGELLDIDIDVNKNEWYENPYVWVGVGVFILLAILFSRIGKKG